MRRIREFIPHLTLSMAIGLMVFVVLDGYNPMMEWLTSSVSKIYMLLLGALTVISCILCVAAQRRRR